jgi:hypothetical protein
VSKRNVFEQIEASRVTEDLVMMITVYYKVCVLLDLIYKDELYSCALGLQRGFDFAGS